MSLCLILNPLKLTCPSKIKIEKAFTQRNSDFQRAFRLLSKR